MIAHDACRGFPAMGLAERTRAEGNAGNATMEIKQSGSQPSGRGPADWFTGTVRIDPLFDAPAPARVAGAASHLSPAPARPGTRTRWARR